MNDGELRVLEYVREQINGLREDHKELREAIKDMRNEMQTTFMRHDESDNDRFAELFERLRPLEIAVGIQEHMDAQETQAEHRRHGYAVARIGAIAAVIGGVGGAIVSEILHWFFAFFTQRGH